MSPTSFDSVLETPPISANDGRSIGRSREGRPIVGYRIGPPFAGRPTGGPPSDDDEIVSVTLLGGCHADEPVGPWMLRRLAAWLLALPSDAELRRRFAWTIVPHANPDGEARNESWAGRDEGNAVDPGRAFDFECYRDRRIREAPGDDIEFGFPSHAQDLEARPENRAIAAFFEASASMAGPARLHASFHGMGFSGGPWFLLDRLWIDRTQSLRRVLADRVADMGYSLHDVQRNGDKGFTRIERGFCTCPDSDSMRDHFLVRGDPETASLFRPSSMEFATRLAPGALTVVSEMPLFIVPGAGDTIEPNDPILDHFRAHAEPHPSPMPVRDQMSLQLSFLEEALRAVTN